MGLISRQTAIDAFEKELSAKYNGHEMAIGFVGVKSILQGLPSAQPEVDLRKRGEWDMFELITSAWYGKQYYFKQSNDIVYSRLYHKYMTVDEAIIEFLGEITDG